MRSVASGAMMAAVTMAIGTHSDTPSAPALPMPASPDRPLTIPAMLSLMMIWLPQMTPSSTSAAIVSIDSITTFTQRRPNTTASPAKESVTSAGSACSATVAIKYSERPVEQAQSTVTHMAGTTLAYWYASGTAMTPPPMKQEVRFSAVPKEGLLTRSMPQQRLVRERKRDRGVMNPAPCPRYSCTTRRFTSGDARKGVVDLLLLLLLLLPPPPPPS